MKNLVTSLKMSRKLQEAGFEAGAPFYWVENPNNTFTNKEEGWRLHFVHRENIETEHVPAYTLQQLFEALPDEIRVERKDFHFGDNIHSIKVDKTMDSTEVYYELVDEYCPCGCNDPYHVLITFCDDNLIKSAASAVLWCLKNKYLTKQKI